MDSHDVPQRPANDGVAPATGNEGLATGKIEPVAGKVEPVAGKVEPAKSDVSTGSSGGGSLGRVSSALFRRPIIIAAVGLLLIVAIYLMARPLFYYDENDYRNQGLHIAVNLIGPIPDENFEAARVDSLLRQVNPPIAISVGIFATARVPIRLRTVVDSGSAPPTEIWLKGKNWTKNVYLTVAADTPTLQYNWDFIILAIGSAIVAVAGLWAFYKPSMIQQALTLPSVLTKGTLPQGAELAEEYLIVDVQRALSTSEQLFSRSTLLLVGGVVMAFVGVGVFFLSISLRGSTPAAIRIADILIRADGGFPWQQLTNAVRSFAMLFFIEAVAWFLLRQYRSLIEDYKLFYKQYMRRAQGTVQQNRGGVPGRGSHWASPEGPNHRKP
jgi:hypothetical protein